MTSPDIEMRQTRQQLLTRLDRYGRSLRVRLLARGIARVGGMVVLLLALSILADWKLDLSSTARTIFLACCGVAVVIAAWFYLIRDQLHHWSPLDLAGVYDRASAHRGGPAIAPRIATALNLSLDETPQQSAEMAHEAVRQSYAAVQNLDFRESLGLRSHALRLSALVACIAIPLIFWAAAPRAAQIWRDRWLLGLNTPWPRSTTIVLQGLTEDGSLLVPRNEPTTLRIFVTGKKRAVRSIRLDLKPQGGRTSKVSLSATEGATDTADANVDGEHGLTTEFHHELAPLAEPTSLRIHAGDARLGPVWITPIDRPRIESLVLSHQHPWDDGPQTHDFDRDDALPSLLPETMATLRVKGNVPFAKLEISSDSTADKSIQWEQVDDRTWVATWTHHTAVQLSMTLVGLAQSAGEVGLKSHSRSLAIGLQRDRPPTITLRHSGVRRRVTPTAKIPLSINARDDYGLAAVQLSWIGQRAQQTPAADEFDASRLLPPLEEFTMDEPMIGTNAMDDSSSAPLRGAKSFVEPVDSEASQGQPTSPGAQTVVEPYSLSIADMKLAPGDLIKLQAVAEDACHTGSQTTKTPGSTFRIVKPDDLFREILLRQQQLRARLRSATNRAESLRDEINLAELPQSRSELIRTLRTVQRDVSAVHRGLDATVLEMELNDLGGPESLDLIRTTVIQPLQALHDGLLSRQLAAMESLDESSRESVMEREQIIVDTMKGILKSMAQWDSFIDVVNQLESVIKLQKSLKAQAERLKKKEIDSVFE